MSSPLISLEYFLNRIYRIDKWSVTPETTADFNKKLIQLPI